MQSVLYRGSGCQSDSCCYSDACARDISSLIPLHLDFGNPDTLTPFSKAISWQTPPNLHNVTGSSRIREDQVGKALNNI